MKPTIAIIGATGKAGYYITKVLMEQGYPVKALVRNPAKLTHSSPLLTVVQGDATQPDDITRLLTGCTYIINAIGQPGNPAPVFSRVTSNIIQAVPQTGVLKYLLITGLSIDVAGDDKSERVQQLSAWMREQYPELIADKQHEYQLLEASSISWTIVRLPVIEQTEKRYAVEVSITDCPGEKISATDIGYFLASQLESEAFIRQAPFIANK
ncbi:putative NADH-flavin reductase [Filimonas zeae]|uniref:NADH-flavin reductase n=1 Tax=Filimonas zeae TaxID=1737353 RepID=A0A917MS64_9BACT|nr:NAD(P)H-binding protein [Filimonas zeae]MDR6337926.1 putative NADH-flavin reductase [Filimonas zeae]GGH60901.1 NADH-flavin reductase [Filimonas zeae]